MPNTRHWANVIHVRKTSGLTNTGAIAVADPLIVALWTSVFSGGAKLSQFMHVNWKMDRIRYTPLDGTTATTVFPHTLPGLTSSSDPLPANVALAFTSYTAKRGRRHRGRTFLCGWAEDSNGGVGILASSYQTLLQQQLNGWLASFTSSGVSLVVASYGYSELKNETISTWTPDAENVTSLVLNGTWDTQRRRNRP